MLTINLQLHSFRFIHSDSFIHSLIMMRTLLLCLLVAPMALGRVTILGTQDIVDMDLSRILLQKAVPLADIAGADGAADITGADGDIAGADGANGADADQSKSSRGRGSLPEPEFMSMYRSLEDGDSEDDGDDYYNYGDTTYDFSSFSLKYAKCQSIQRFSEDAITNGEYSAMVKDDIVILRLCPTSQCNSNKQYGCRYNYVEYAIGVVDYVKMMLKYTIDKRTKMCTFCSACGNRRRLEDDEDDNDQDSEDDSEEDDNDNDDNEDDEQFDDDDYYKADDDGAAAAADDDDGAAAAADDDAVTVCDTYQDECDSINGWCNGAADDDVGYLDYEDYFDYLDCVKIEGNDNANYYIRPRCDPYKETIHMDIYYDPYCSQYAGNDINLREFSGLYFQTSVFEPFYSGTCLDCTESVSFM